MPNASHIPLMLDISHAFKAGRPERGGHDVRVTASVKNSVFMRDRYLCRCCGFTSKKYQEVLVMKGNARDVDNLATACIFCHQCFNLDRVPVMRSGVLIRLPEFTQEQLHHIARDIFRARITKDETAARARLAFDYLEARQEGARALLGTDDPGVLAEELRDVSTERQRVELAGRLEGIRLLPNGRRMVREAELEFNMFPQILAFWRSRHGPFKGEASYPWLDYFDRELAERGTRPQNTVTSEMLRGVPHSQLAAKLLRDAAGLFRTLGEENAPVKNMMEENVLIYERVAALVEGDPTGRPGSGKLDPAATDSYAALAAKLLRDAARFFRSLSEKNPPLKGQMLQNEEVFVKLAELIESDPTGRLE